MPPLRPKLPSGSRSAHEIITIGDSPVTPSTGLPGVQPSLLLVLFLSFKKTEMRVHSMQWIIIVIVVFYHFHHHVISVITLLQ